MNTLIIPAGTYSLGWRHTLSDEARAGVDSFLHPDVYQEAFSPGRQVQLAGFEMQALPVSVEELLGSLDDDLLDGLTDLTQACDLLDGLLAPTGWRVPTEDELEAALGGELFRWGDVIPTGTPYEPGDFALHRGPDAAGLVMPHDSYGVEVTRSAFKMGDGGCAVCGDYPWPVAWLTLSPCARVPEELLEDLWVWLQGATVHPVR